jgi:hypothetical protein
MKIPVTEWASNEVIFYTCFQVALSSNLGQDTGYNYEAGSIHVGKFDGSQAGRRAEVVGKAVG